MKRSGGAIAPAVLAKRKAPARDILIGQRLLALEQLVLPLRQLLQISIYWLGINAIWGGVGIFNQQRVDDLAPPGEAGSYLNLMGWLALPVVLLVQPTIGALSDYTITRWGKRKPYIVIGATLDVVFLIGLATSQTFIALVVFGPSRSSRLSTAACEIGKRCSARRRRMSWPSTIRSSLADRVMSGVGAIAGSYR